ncbi:hypothetical protein C1645_834894 [Glomus cerebriforme]|uniref:Uncharacterized protein n=1 Tax=Glomus cerebriforme TaxID=658196 RepID=A0A397S8S4_9GLOM|nr:hypothetical protein C1645_834894 [Glomus cerebriforme]
MDIEQIRNQMYTLGKILEGKRETPTPNTYTKYWQDNPEDRLDIQQVFFELKSINLNLNEMNEMNEMKPFENFKMIEYDKTQVNEHLTGIEEINSEIENHEVGNKKWSNDQSVEYPQQGTKLHYMKKQYNKELCGFLVKGYNNAIADLNIRKIENAEFFSKRDYL